jgi:hypothetical protein
MSCLRWELTHNTLCSIHLCMGHLIHLTGGSNWGTSTIVTYEFSYPFVCIPRKKHCDKLHLQTQFSTTPVPIIPVYNIPKYVTKFNHLARLTYIHARTYFTKYPYVCSQYFQYHAYPTPHAWRASTNIDIFVVQQNWVQLLHPPHQTTHERQHGTNWILCDCDCASIGALYIH